MWPLKLMRHIWIKKHWLTYWWQRCFNGFKGERRQKADDWNEGTEACAQPTASNILISSQPRYRRAELTAGSFSTHLNSLLQTPTSSKELRFVQISQYKYIKSNVGRFIWLDRRWREGGGVYWNQWNKKEEYNNHILHFQFFSVVPSSSFYILTPEG